MKKIFLLFVTLCLAHICFAQVKVNSVGNTGIGATPNTKAKLLLNSQAASTDTVFGIHSTTRNTTGSRPLYGAYFKNIQSGSSTGTTYGIYTENKNTTYAGGLYGFYAKNTTSGYAGSVYGIYTDNVSDATNGIFCGAYIKNTKRLVTNNTTGGTSYGIQVINIDSSAYTPAYGIHVNNTKITGAPGSISYGIYTSVSGGFNENSRYAGYFTGGKVVMMNGNVGIGRENPAYLLDVNGTIRVSSTLYSSDERLKSDIKPLTNEKDKLYLLQGKSYKKALIPVDIKDSLTLATAKKTKEKTIETPEYGYLAQELKEVFPDLVSQDSAGYYSVNYIGLIPVIVEALKGQRLEIEEKQVQIEKQQVQIEKQQVQMDEQREQIKQLVKLMGIKSIDKKVFEENGIESIPLLLQNTPNPFNQSTEIGYFIPETVGSANIYIYDVNGVQQRNISIAERGNGVTVLQATALQAGIYFYTLICDGKPVDTKQMILTK